MEEAVWDEIINPSPLSVEPGQRLALPRPPSTVIFQDFLGQPYNIGLPRTNAFAPAPLSISSSSATSSLTALSLHSGLEFPMHSHHLTNVSNPAFNAGPFDAMANSGSPVGFPCFGPKRPVPDSEDAASSGDHRHKRMIKNRESAARSRARKQAYTNELELVIANLIEENAKLTKQQEQYRMTMAAQHSKTKHKLHRSSTAFF